MNKVFPSFATFHAYDVRGEVTNAARAASSDSYAYDSIGNRRFSSDLFGPRAYDANSVNEYAAVTNLAATPPEAEEPEWDADGNLTSFGGTTFEWDARGRLVRVEKECADGSVVEVGFAYDWRNRLVERIFTRMVGRTVVDTDFREYVWDDWLLLLERKEDADGGFTDIEYVWGPDLSGAMQGAGGVGGLLAVSVDGDYYFPFYDNNGNVMGYADENRSCVARYDYDAFGNLVASSGPMADFFPHRFSTKYLDPDLGLYYYGYRWYSPELGRWISRDPIQEEGGLNLFVFCENAPTRHVDPLGTDRYITQFDIFGLFGTHENRMNTQLHMGVAVDRWEKGQDNHNSRCWHWQRVGVVSFDFGPDMSSILGYPALIATIGKGKVRKEHGLTLQAPERIESTPEEDRLMLDVINAQLIHPPPYNIFVMNCIQWSLISIHFGRGVPDDPGPYDKPRVRWQLR